MKIIHNGKPCEITAVTLADALVELGFGEAVVATAVNEVFVPVKARGTCELVDEDRVEVLAPRQGG